MQIPFIMMVCNVTFTTGNTAPYCITQPPANNDIQIVFPNVTRMKLSCALNVSIPSGMIITWLYNDNVEVNLTTNREQTKKSVTLIRNIQPADSGAYQCVFSDTAIGLTLSRNITVLSMYNSLNRI